MSIYTLVICSFLTTAELFFILYSLNPHWLKVALGYSWVLDITLGLGMSLIMLSTGSLGGLVMSAISGAVLSVSLIAMKKSIGYRKFKTINGKKCWVEYPKVITKDNIINFKDKVINKVTNLNFNKTIKVA